MLKRIHVHILNLSDSAKIIFFSLVLLSIAAIVYWLRSLPLGLFASGILIGLLLLLTKPIWLPYNSSPKIFRRISVLFLELVAFSYGVWAPKLETLLHSYVSSGEVPELFKATPIEHSPTLIFAVLLGSTWLTSRVLRDNTAMGKLNRPIENDIPEPHFREQLQNVCESLNEDLRGIDLRTNWSTKKFTPLDAEVEVKTDYGKRRRIGDLLKTIKNSESRLFLVLGDPGSGKSVSLRKLCQDLSKEVRITGKIPIYVNLKEWQIEKKWDYDNPPTPQHLSDFILDSIKSKDILIGKFFTKYYDRLYESGRLYFVLDSFDEIPAVLDEKENSELIKKLSEVIFKFLKGSRSKESQGILASRIFRKPTSEFQTSTILEIRPFSEKKIINTLKTSGHFNKELINKIFLERSDLVPIIRNPLMTQLLAEYVENNSYSLPSNQFELFNSYINSTLQNCQSKIDRFEMNVDQVKNITISIAEVIFKNYGLEGRIRDIRNNIPNSKVEETIEILKFSRIGRSGSTDENIFSFSHRRFCEFFAIQQKINSNEDLDLTSIPNDSQWRDALVLYCEVADEVKAKKVANFCWSVIYTIGDSSDIRSIHSLRFLRDAFKGRLECLVDFRDELERYINSQLAVGNNIISTKIAVESIGLLRREKINDAILKALETRNYWIEEVAIKSCVHISSIDEKLQQKIISTISSMNFYEFILRYPDLKFSFSLSNAFQKISKKLLLKYIEIISIIITHFLTVCFVPTLYLSAFITMFLVSFNFFTMRLSIENRGLEFAQRIIPPLTWFFFIKFGEDNLMFLNNLSAFKGIFPYTMLTISIFQFLLLYSYEIGLLFKSLVSMRKLPPITLGFNWSRRTLRRPIIVLLSILGLFLCYRLVLLLGYLSYLILAGKILAGIIAVGTLGLFVYSIYYNFKNHIKHKKQFREVIVSRLNDRSYIYNCYAMLKKSPYWQEQLLNVLESDIKQVDGTWPDTKFLKVTSDKNLTRLARLEEKWLRINN